MRIDKEIYKYIDFELQHFEDNKKKLNELREEIIESSPNPPDGQPRGEGNTSNPTEQKGMKLITSVALIKIEKTIKSIEKVYSKLEKDYRLFFDLHYIRGFGIVKTCNEASISERTYYNMRDKIVYSVGMELGLI